MKQAIETFGGLNVLVNNAGILRDVMSFNTSEEDWDAVIRVHLKGHFAPTKFASAYWREQSKAGNPVSAAIINTSSDSGLFSNAGQSAYDAAKAGIASLTLCLARELERYGVRVNAIAPRARTRLTATVGLTETPDEARSTSCLPRTSRRSSRGWPAPVRQASTARSSPSAAAPSSGCPAGIRPASCSTTSGWTVDDLIAQQGTLFGGGSSATPTQSIPGLDLSANRTGPGRPRGPSRSGRPGGDAMAGCAERLAAERDFWLSTVARGGGPHVAPVWGVVVDDVWFCYSERRTVKGRNLAADAGRQSISATETTS